MKSYLESGAYYPVGGASSIARHLLPTITGNGGEARAGVEVTSLIMNNGVVSGVETADGESFFAKHIVSNVGARETIDQSLPDGHGHEDWLQAIRLYVSSGSTVRMETKFGAVFSGGQPSASSHLCLSGGLTQSTINPQWPAAVSQHLGNPSPTEVFMKTASLLDIRASIALGLLSVIFGQCVAPPTLFADEAPRITHGPILGHLSADGVGVWARTSRPSEFRVRYGTTPDHLGEVSDAVTTALDRDNTGWARLSGLKSNTTYYYQLVAARGSQVTPEASFHTLPTAAQVRHAEHNPKGLFNFRFEFACGNRPQMTDDGSPPRPTYVTMLRELRDEIDFAILNGDWLYEVKRDYPVEQWLKQVGRGGSQPPRLVRLAPGIVGVWENYKYYLDTDPALAAWHREVPSFFTFDDHEILNDINGTGEIGYRNARTVFRDVGVRAWRQYLGWSSFPEFQQPIRFGEAALRLGSDVLVDTTAEFSTLDLDQVSNLHIHWGARSSPGDANAGVYEIVEVLDQHRLRVRPPLRADTTSVYSIGHRSYWRMPLANCEFFFLDTRSERTLHDKGNPHKAGVTMLGANQRRWLMDKMLASDADFFFLVSSVNLTIPHVDPKGRSNKDEAWTSFLEERELLIDFWDQLGKPVFVLTGDLHNSFAIQITDRVWEFASGPHSSTNHSAPHEAGRPPNGPYQSGPRRCDIRWSSYVLADLGRKARLPHYCVVQVNNVFRNPDPSGGPDRHVAFPQPHVVFQYYEGHTGRLAYAETVFAVLDELNRIGD